MKLILDVHEQMAVALAKEMSPDELITLAVLQDKFPGAIVYTRRELERAYILKVNGIVGVAQDCELNTSQKLTEYNRWEHAQRALGYLPSDEDAANAAKELLK